MSRPPKRGSTKNCSCELILHIPCSCNRFENIARDFTYPIPVCGSSLGTLGRDNRDASCNPKHLRYSRSPSLCKQKDLLIKEFPHMLTNIHITSWVSENRLKIMLSSTRVLHSEKPLWRDASKILNHGSIDMCAICERRSWQRTWPCTESTLRQSMVSLF